MTSRGGVLHREPAEIGRCAIFLGHRGDQVVAPGRHRIPQPMKHGDPLHLRGAGHGRESPLGRRDGKAQILPVTETHGADPFFGGRVEEIEALAAVRRHESPVDVDPVDVAHSRLHSSSTIWIAAPDPIRSAIGDRLMRKIAQ